MTTPSMAQPGTVHANGDSRPASEEVAQHVVPGKRKRDDSEKEDGPDEVKPVVTNAQHKKSEKELVKSFYQVLSGYVLAFSLRKVDASPWMLSCCDDLILPAN